MALNTVHFKLGIKRNSLDSNDFEAYTPVWHCSPLWSCIPPAVQMFYIEYTECTFLLRAGL